MIKNFNTASGSSGEGSSEGKGSNTLLTVVVIAGLLFAGYYFFVKPSLNKEEEKT